MRTLVLEHNMVAGGCSQVFRRRGVWEFDVGVHYVGQCEPGGAVTTVLHGLGLDTRIEWLELDPDGYATLTFPDLTFRVPRGWDNYLTRLIETFPAEERQLRRCIGILRWMARDAVKGVPQGLDLMLAPLRTPSAVVGSSITVTQLFDLCRLGPRARAVIIGECGDYACPPSKTSALFHAGFLNHYLDAGGFYPKGGGQVLAAHLIDVIQTHGGAVHTKTDVERILIERGRVAGVRLSSGQTLRAPVVVSNADIKRTYLELVGEYLKPEIPGLFLAGASTFYNHGVGGVITGGLGTAAAILGRDLAQEVRAGRVFADPTKLTEFGPDWDPWLYSKPRAGHREPGRARRTTSV